VCCKPRSFALICFPHRNDVAGVAALRPDHYDKAAPKVTRSDHPGLGIVESRVLIVEGDPGENLCGVLEIEPRGLPGSLLACSGRS
jgi:hypothetical protein